MFNINLEIDKKYAEKINKLAENGGTNAVFYNSNERHAAIVLHALVKNASDYIKILCCNMCTDVSNNQDYLNALDSFLSGNENRKIQILLVNYNDIFIKQPIARLLARYSGQVSVKRMVDTNTDICLNGRPVHFTVSDNRAFRLETDIEKKMAYGNFKDEYNAQILCSVFERYFNSDNAQAVSLC